MPKLNLVTLVTKPMDSCTISDGQVIGGGVSKKPLQKRSIPPMPDTPRKQYIAKRCVLSNGIVTRNGVRGIITEVGSPPPSPYKPPKTNA